jgi:hypothetical protein
LKVAAKQHPGFSKTFFGCLIFKSGPDFSFPLDPSARMDLRTKCIKRSKLVQLVESYRNEEGQPGQKGIVSVGDAQLPERRKALNCFRR